MIELVGISFLQWLIDWGFSGFYPPFSEYASIYHGMSMAWIEEPGWWPWWQRIRWNFFRIIAVGPINAYKGLKTLRILPGITVKYKLFKPPGPIARY